MRKDGVQLLNRVRQGDAVARCEVGRYYLLGLSGFPLHLATGIDYLTHESVAALPAAARVVAESLSLVDLIKLEQTVALERAAVAGSIPAQVKFAAWCLLDGRGADAALPWLAAAAAAGHLGAKTAHDALVAAPPHEAVLVVMQALDTSGDVDGSVVARQSAQKALTDRRLPLLVECTRAALELSGAMDAELATLIAGAAQLAESTGAVLEGLPAAAVRDGLERRAVQGDRQATFMFGCGVCGIDTPALPAEIFVDHHNIRKGAAFLLRAADAGCDEAWPHLYRLHADHRLSVANQQLARFFLEKAALRGHTEAQRKLGALMLREADVLEDSEQAIHWLHQAAESGDRLAATLLTSLVLPVAADEKGAAIAIEQVRRLNPWLATRLELSRAFGLTKLEALCVDPVDGLRPWGMVVGRNPFIHQVRLSAPRAVPSTSPAAYLTARRAAAFFGQSRGESGAAEGDLRARSLRQRRIFERLALDEAWFFSDATSMTLDSLRQGAKWAHRARQPLREALAT